MIIINPFYSTTTSSASFSGLPIEWHNVFVEQETNGLNALLRLISFLKHLGDSTFYH
jgi:hypothetical protein